MESYKQKLPVVFCLLSAAALVAANLFLFNTFEVYRDNADEFELGFLTLLEPIATWGGIFISLALAPAVILSLSGLRRYTSLMLMLGILIWVQANFLLWDYGEFDGRDTGWAQFDVFGWLDVSIWLVFVVISLRFSHRLLPLTHLVAWILIVGQAVLLFNQQGLAVNDSEKRLSLAVDPPEALFELSSQQNIVHIVLDSMQSDMFLEISNQLDLHDELSGFTLFYENAGVTPHTSLALPAIFTGKEFDASQSLSEYYQYAMTDGFQASLFDAGYTVNLVPNLSMRGSKFSNYYQIPSTYTDTTGDLLKQNAASLMDVALFRGAPHFLRMSLYDEGNWFLLPIVRGDKPVRSFREKAFLSDYTNNLRLGSDTPAYHFIHLWPPHPPYVTDANGEYAGEVLPNNRENYRNEAKAVITHIVEVIQRLKSLGVYEDALIVLQGDHGSQISPIVNGNEMQPCVTRIPAMLAVKLPGSDGKMKLSDAPTSLLDVAPTILTVLDEADGPGFNLEEVPVRQRSFFVFDDKDEAARINKYLIEGSVYDPDNCRFQAHLELNANVDAYQPGTQIWFGLTGNGDAYMGSGWSMCQSNHCWSNGRAADIVLPIAMADKDLELQVTFKPFIDEEKLPRQRINVSVNGTSMTTWLTSEFVSQTATVRIPASLAGDELLNIKFQFPDAASPKALNLGGDARKLGIALTGLRLDTIDSQ